MKKLNLKIVEVENGYVVTENLYSRRGERGRKYVTITAAGLGQMVTDLAQEASKGDLSDGEVQEPKA